jgi:DNA (cytosine-5)-methyltransferase 1
MSSMGLIRQNPGWNSALTNALKIKSNIMSQTPTPAALTYIDLFAGCGGLSLGLKHAGWEGVFAVERNPMAFETLSHNLIESQNSHFAHWPDWLPKKACSIQILTEKHAENLKKLRGKVTLIAGGPPCQGFSSAGRRQKNDHRNKLYQSYIDVVALVKPKIVLLENVTGIKMHFGPRPSKKKAGRHAVPYSERIKASLAKLEYKVYDDEVLASAFGVPQSRTRFIAIGIDTTQIQLPPNQSPFDVLRQLRPTMLKEKGLPTNVPVGCQDALSDLEYNVSTLIQSPDSKKFKAGKYSEALSPYQILMRNGIANGEIADSHRFVNHHPHIIERFQTIMKECARGKNISDSFREKHGLKKACIVPMDPLRPAGTVTTIPDDMIHYSQPRVLTVRECARLQSFPDTFSFKSKYTTGGSRRKKECPRYTQVGNAVPPLLGEALGKALSIWLKTASSADSKILSGLPPAFAA